MMRLWHYIAFALGIAFIIYFVSQSNLMASLSNDALASLIFSVALLVWIGGSAVDGYKGKLGKAAKDVGIWLVIVAVLAVGYSFRHELDIVYNRVAGELIPSRAVSSFDGDSVVFRRGDNGHFNISTSINGADIDFIVDTGASTVVLSSESAERIGINIDELNFSRLVSTANGTTSVAPISIPLIRIGSIELDNVRASVSRPGDLEGNLFGLTALDKLDSYEIANDILTFNLN